MLSIQNLRAKTVGARCVLGLTFALTSFTALAQSPNCDEGVIRLPDRSGTVVICSAVASKLPQLAKQLTDATRLLGNQQSQITELTRLVRGLNGVSKGIGTDRQAQMLQSLSSELASAQRGGDDKTKHALENLGEKIEELQSQMLSALTNPSSSAATSAAIKGAVGDSIAKLELSSAARQLGEINTRLQAIQGQLGDVKNDTKVIKQDLKDVQSTLNGVAKEVSDDPRKELVKRGYTVDGRGLEKAMLQKDFIALANFNKTGYLPRYAGFDRFLFSEGWDPAVFNALSSKMIGAPESCDRWHIPKSGDEINKEKLSAMVGRCGKESMIAKLKKSRSVYEEMEKFDYPSKEDKKARIEDLRKQINPGTKSRDKNSTSMAAINECTFSRDIGCKPSISPSDFAEIEAAHLKEIADKKSEDTKWKSTVDQAIEKVRKM